MKQLRLFQVRTVAKSNWNIKNWGTGRCYCNARYTANKTTFGITWGAPQIPVPTRPLLLPAHGRRGSHAAASDHPLRPPGSAGGESLLQHKLRPHGEAERAPEAASTRCSFYIPNIKFVVVKHLLPAHPSRPEHVKCTAWKWKLLTQVKGNHRCQAEESTVESKQFEVIMPKGLSWNGKLTGKKKNSWIFFLSCFSLFNRSLWKVL